MNKTRKVSLHKQKLRKKRLKGKVPVQSMIQTEKRAEEVETVLSEEEVGAKHTISRRKPVRKPSATQETSQPESVAAAKPRTRRTASAKSQPGEQSEETIIKRKVRRKTSDEASQPDAQDQPDSQADSQG